MSKPFGALAIVAALLGIAVCWQTSGNSSGQEPAKAPPRTKWEYKIVVANGGTNPGQIEEKKLQELGDEGWDLYLVSEGQPYVRSSTTRFTAFGRPDNTATDNTIQYSRTSYYFKRAK
jgi:hypothetical protein